MANPATEKLLKILRLESQNGNTDKAVTRGLASFAAAWLADAARNNVDPAWAEGVAQEMRAYSGLADLAQRKTLLDALVTRVRLPESVRSQEPTRATERATERAAERVRPPEFGNTEGRARSQEAIAEARQASEDMVTSVAAAANVAVATPPQNAPRENRDFRQPRSNQASNQHSTPFEHRSAPEGRKAVKPSAYQPPPGVGLDAPVTMLTGIGEVNAQKLARLGISTIEDLLYFYPSRYDDYSALKTINQLEFGEQVTIIGKVASTRTQRLKTGAVIFRAVIEDLSGMIECSWFTTNTFVDTLAKQFTEGREVVISGKVSEYMGRLIFQQPTHEPSEQEWVTGGNIVPVYRLTEGLQPLLLRRVMKRVSEYWSQRVQEYLPDSVRRQVNLMGLNEALRDIHFPKDPRAQEQARRRLAFDELFVLQVAIQQQRMAWRGEPAQPLRIGEPTLDRLSATVPFSLTNAQQRAIRRIHEDMGKSFAMHRLLQGDVGSGKTVVAALGMAMAATAGAQSAMMAPTEILAEQHYKSLSKLFEAMGPVISDGIETPQPIQIALLTGSVKGAERKAIYEGLANGRIHVVVGTQALIQEGVEFKNLCFVCIDEQHRFGVEQRTALRQKGREFSPHTLVMTATPIPRTLALTLFGDLDNTILDEMPPGRQPIDTHWFSPAERERAYGFVRSQVEQGRQAFVICPLVEESEKIEAKAAVEEHARLQRDIFPKFKLGLLHGRMKPAEKEAVMTAFASGELNILVSTSVVEVGIDVPNATVMMIEGADRFGLSQLHQFRGRVGRGQYASYCLLIANGSADGGAGSVVDERLQAIVDTQDGFKLAEKDLEIRGPGEFFGTRQSGDPELKLVNFRDRDLLDRAREQAERLTEADPQLTQPENLTLMQKVNAFWAVRAERKGDAS